MNSILATALAGGATVVSVMVALLLEFVLLRIILGAIAKGKMEDAPQPELSPDESYRNLRTPAR